MTIQYKKPSWDIPDNIRAYYTTRIGGSSKNNYRYSNLSLDVGDAQTNVKKNRNELKKLLGYKLNPCWMKQIHSSYIKKVSEDTTNVVCDSTYTDVPGLPCVVLSADCLPILVCNKNGSKVGVIHVGWRGLHNGIISKFVKRFSKNPNEITCWIGPSITPDNYIVKEDVYNKLSKISKKIFTKNESDTWKLNLRMCASIILKREGVRKIFGDEMCTYQNLNLYYSYRAQNITGRIASLIWIE